MSKAPDRNAPCPCGSGKKYKKCCIGKLEVAPQQNAPALFQAAFQHQQAGQLELALNGYQEVLALDPGHFGALYHCGLLAHQIGDTRTGIELLQHAANIKRNEPVVYSNLGVLHTAVGDWAEAMVCYRKALEIKPDYADAWNNLAHAQSILGLDGEVEQSYRRALRLNPDHVEANYNLAEWLYKRGKGASAEPLFQTVTKLEPTHVNAWLHLAQIANERNQVDRSVEILNRALEVSPNEPVLHYVLGTAYAALREIERAAQCFRSAVMLKPDYGEAYRGLGELFYYGGMLNESEKYCRQAVQVNPNLEGAHLGLGLALYRLGRSDEALGSFREAVRLRPDNNVAFSYMVLCMQYSPSVTTREIYEAHRRYAQTFEAPLKPYWRQHENSRDPQRKLKIGYVSPDFYEHPVPYFMEPVLANHDREHFEVYSYYSHFLDDDVTERMRRVSDHWLPCHEMTDDELAERIRADGIDILVDLAGHTTLNRLLTFARKPAPVQVTWIGYVGTTGLDAVDYRFTDMNMDPPGLTDWQHSEKLIRLSSAGVFQPDRDAPPVNRLPALEGEPFTFACLNSHRKFTDDNLRVWAEIMQRVPGSRMMFGYAQEAGVRKALLERLAKVGITEEQVLLYPKMTPAEYLAAHNRIDMALDPFPYNGGTTTRHSLWMGVPVVTMAGDRSVSRCGVRNLMYVDLPEFVAETEAEYIEKAVAMARDLPRLDAIRQGLRDAILAQPASDPVLYTREVEAAYRKMWCDWVASVEQEAGELTGA